MTINKGDLAPTFSLYNTEKELISLDKINQDSNVLILFFPLAFTSVCTKEMCSTSDDFSIYSELNSRIVGISVDSIFTLGKFKSENSINFDLLSDFNKDVSRAYGALYEDFVLGMKGVSKRSAFVIDKNGIIKYSEVLENAGEMPNFEKIKKVLKNLES